jgi:hypothetical protein
MTSYTITAANGRVVRTEARANERCVLTMELVCEAAVR